MLSLAREGGGTGPLFNTSRLMQRQPVGIPQRSAPTSSAPHHPVLLNTAGWQFPGSSWDSVRAVASEFLTPHHTIDSLGNISVGNFFGGVLGLPKEQQQQNHQMAAALDSRPRRLRPCPVDSCTRPRTPSETPNGKRCRNLTCAKHREDLNVKVGGLLRRQCMVCYKFHDLSEFEGDRKTCSRVLHAKTARKRAASATASSAKRVKSHDQGGEDTPALPGGNAAVPTSIGEAAREAVTVHAVKAAEGNPNVNINRVVHGNNNDDVVGTAVAVI